MAREMDLENRVTMMDHLIPVNGPIILEMETVNINQQKGINIQVSSKIISSTERVSNSFHQALKSRCMKVSLIKIKEMAEVN